MLEPPKDKRKQAAALASVFATTAARSLVDVAPADFPLALQTAVTSLRAFQALHPAMQEAVLAELTRLAKTSCR